MSTAANAQTLSQVLDAMDTIGATTSWVGLHDRELEVGSGEYGYQWVWQVAGSHVVAGDQIFWGASHTTATAEHHAGTDCVALSRCVAADGGGWTTEYESVNEPKCAENVANYGRCAVTS